MPETDVRLFCTAEGTVPIEEWLRKLPKKAQEKFQARITWLRKLGHELRRPRADFLRDGIWELRVRYQRNRYRVLYFFYGQEAVILSHGFQKKESRVRDSDIERYAGQSGEVTDYYWISLNRGEVFYMYTVQIEASDKELVLHEDELEARTV